MLHVVKTHTLSQKKKNMKIGSRIKPPILVNSRIGVEVKVIGMRSNMAREVRFEYDFPFFIDAI